MKKKHLVLPIMLAMLMSVTACNSPKNNQIELLSTQIEELNSTIEDLKITVDELKAENAEIKATLADTATNADGVCKEAGCTETVIYQEGYCKFHYYTNVGETAIKDFLND